ncbi:MAG TPA: hypothetical protein VFF06_27235 [Polyangia bacterium]|nr:hypothetical protein [Polyangia bacterium]
MTWAIVGGVVALVAVLGVLAVRAERHTAAAKLLDAQAAFQRGDFAGALKLLKDALWVPLGDKYGAADARTAAAAVGLLEDVLKKMGTDPAPLTAVLKGELAAASQAGGPVAQAVIDPVKRFLDGDRDGWLAQALARKTLGGDARPQPQAGADLITVAAEQAQVVSTVGRALGAGKIDDALTALDTNLQRADGAFRATLLSQRGGASALKQDFVTAAADHAEAAKLEPDNAAHAANLAESLEKLGDPAGALGAAQKALDLQPLADVRDLASGVIRRLTALGAAPPAGDSSTGN